MLKEIALDTISVIHLSTLDGRVSRREQRGTRGVRGVSLHRERPPAKFNATDPGALASGVHLVHYMSPYVPVRVRVRSAS